MRIDPTIDLPEAWYGSVLDRFAEHVSRGPSNVCIGCGDRQYTYSEVARASDMLAGQLNSQIHADHGIISILAERTEVLGIGLLGVLKAGFAFHLIDPKYPISRIIEQVEYLKPVGILNTCVNTDLFHRIMQTFSNRTECFMGHITNEMILGDGRMANPALQNIRPVPAASPDSLMYVAFTSGTTGVPRAVWGAHGPVSHFFHWYQSWFGIKPHDRISVLSGLAHDPLLRDVLMPFWSGCSTWFPPMDIFAYPAAIYQWLKKDEITIVHLTPSLCHLLLNIPKTSGRPLLPSLRLALFGGEPLYWGTVKRFQEIAPNAEVVNCYGATETPQIMGYFKVNNTSIDEASVSTGNHSVPIGFGIDGVQLLVLDQTGKICPQGITGEICIRTKYRAMRVESILGEAQGKYRKNPFTNSPDDIIYHTGDFGTYLPDGAVSFVGRKDSQIKVRGFRVDIGEIARALDQCVGPGRFHLDVENSRFGNSIVLYIAAAQGACVSTDAVLRQLGETLPQYMLPARIQLVPKLPLSPNGKIDREKLRKMAALATEHELREESAGQTESADFSQRSVFSSLCSLQTEIFNEVAATWPPDSLGTVALACAIEERFGVRLSARELLLCPSLSALAELIVDAVNQQEKPSNLGVDDRTMNVVSGSEERTSSTEPSPLKQVFRPRMPTLLPRNEKLLRGILNRALQILARVAPDMMRVKLHRCRGVRIGNNVSVGYDSIIETAYPWLVRIGDHVNIGMRVTIIAHFRGMERAMDGGPTVVLEDRSFVGPGVIILPNVCIGEGAVIAAGSVVSASIPPYCLAQGNPAKVIARCGVPLSGQFSYADFLNNLSPIERKTWQHKSGACSGSGS